MEVLTHQVDQRRRCDCVANTFRRVKLICLLDPNANWSALMNNLQQKSSQFLAFSLGSCQFILAKNWKLCLRIGLGSQLSGFLFADVPFDTPPIKNGQDPHESFVVVILTVAGSPHLQPPALLWKAHQHP